MFPILWVVYVRRAGKEDAEMEQQFEERYLRYKINAACLSVL
ncbi:MAG: hypothetical protein ACE5IT_09425 [bacterium]